MTNLEADQKVRDLLIHHFEGPWTYKWEGTP
jgi:hypothetical protein